MPLTKAKGNMYDWCDFVHTSLGGECPHRCDYCSTSALRRRFSIEKYTGPLRLIDKELTVHYGTGRTIFIEHCNDLWAKEVPGDWIGRVLDHCCEWPDNEYVFQSKNPDRFGFWLSRMPPRRLLGCTIETTDSDVVASISAAPAPWERRDGMLDIRQRGERTFVTVEPILRGDMMELTDWIADIHPEFCNIGADSKGTRLEEPSGDDVRLLLSELKRHGVEVRQKTNLERLLR